VSSDPRLDRAPVVSGGSSPTPADPKRAARPLSALVLALLVAVSAGGSAWLVGRAVLGVRGNQEAPWILGRAAGVTTYLLLVALVALGLVLSHPWRTRIAWPSAATRIRVHVSLAVFTLAFLILHVVVLATDSYAGVGWRGAFVPLGTSYRPVPVTLGLVAAYAGLLAGLTAALAGRVAIRIWWPIHKTAALTLAAVWLHAVLAGSDTTQLLPLYVGTGGLVVVLALSRYAARTPADRVEELTRSDDRPAR
jgi:hypothetical protein